MQVGVEPEFLGPGVKDGGKAGLGGKALPTLGQFEERFGGGLEEQWIEDLPVLLLIALTEPPEIGLMEPLESGLLRGLGERPN